jgi:hypothetical protein
MKHWINKNYKTLIVAAFLIPIMTVAVVSISHVTKWYGISNPMSWSIYLSVGIEIAALSALAAISANMGKKVYFPFAVVTIVQFIGNIFFAYSYIDINSKSFKDWVELVSPILEIIGVDPTDPIGHKRFLAFFAGGMLPIISLSFLHMLVKFTEEDRKSEIIHDIDDKLNNKVEASEIISEVSRLRLSDEDLEILAKHLENPLPPNEHLKSAAKKYQEKNEPSEAITSTPEVVSDVIEEEVYPSLSDEEIMEMNQQEYERTLDVPEDEFDGFVPEPFATPEEVEKFNIDNLDKTLEIVNEEIDNSNEPIYQSETKEIDEIINVVDNAMDESPKEEEEKKK